MLRETRSTRAAVLATAESFTSVSVLLIYAILARVFAPADYATFRQTLLTYNLAAPLLALGLPTGLIYFLGTGNPRKVLYHNFITSALVGGMMSAFLLLGGASLISTFFRNDELERCLLTFAPYPIAAIPLMSISPALVSAKRVKTLASFTVVSRSVIVLLVIFVAFFWRDLLGVVAVVSWSQIIVALTGTGLVCLVYGGVDRRFDTELLRRQLAYGIPLAVAAAIATLNTHVTSLIVAKTADLESFAIYVNAAVRVPLLPAIAGSIGMTILPDVVRHFHDGNEFEGLELWRRATVKSLAIALPIAGLLFVLADDIMVTLFSERYLKSVDPFRVLLLLLPVKMLYFGVIFQAANRTWLLLIGSAISIVLNIPLAYVLTSAYGYLGAAWSCVLVFYCVTAPFYLIAMSRVTACSIRRSMPWLPCLILVTIVSVSVPPAILLKQSTSHAFFSIVLGAISFAAIYGILLVAVYDRLFERPIRRC